MDPLLALDARLSALEGRVSDLEDGLERLRRLNRQTAQLATRLGRLLDHLGLAPVTEEEIDAAMGQESQPQRHRQDTGDATRGESVNRRDRTRIEAAPRSSPGW